MASKSYARRLLPQQVNAQRCDRYKPPDPNAPLTLRYTSAATAVCTWSEHPHAPQLVWGPTLSVSVSQRLPLREAFLSSNCCSCHHPSTQHPSTRGPAISLERLAARTNTACSATSNHLIHECHEMYTRHDKVAHPSPSVLVGLETQCGTIIIISHRPDVR